MKRVLVNTDQLLETQVKEYVPNTYSTYLFQGRHRPLFTQATIRDMVIDPRVMFGLWLIKGPMLSKAKFNVDCENEDVKQFIADQIHSFWLNGAVQALKAIEWGFSAGEVLYRMEDGTERIVYRGLKDFEPPSCRVVTCNGEHVGIVVQNYETTNMRPGRRVYLGGPKVLHHIHWRHYNPHYGRSRLVGAHIPWNEIWSEGGYRDIRRMWFYRNAFEGGTLYHPHGTVKTPDGRIMEYQNIAQEILEKKRTGAVMSLPNDLDNKGNRQWEYIEPRGNTIPPGLFDYGDSLRIEILEAMGIPYEVIEASGNEGFGSSTGRQIPETAFYAILQEHLNWLIYDFCEQIARPLVQINAALGKLPYEDFKVWALPLDSGNTPGQEFDQEDESMLRQQEMQNQPDPETGEAPKEITDEEREARRQEKQKKQNSIAI